MEQYDNKNKGVLFKEQGEKVEDWHDDYKGTIDIEGVEYWIGAAIRKSKAGVSYRFALRFSSSQHERLQ